MIGNKGDVYAVLQHEIYPVETVGYRVKDFKYLWLKEDSKNSLKEKFEAFSFDSPSGILQYPLLPLLNNHTNGWDIGCTSLVKMDGLSERFGSNVLMKCEHKNPSGSFKDRETLIAFLHSEEKKYKAAIGFSSGNACCSAALMAKRAGKPFIAVVSGDIYQEKLDFIIKQGADVIVIGGPSCYFEKAFHVFSRAKRTLELELKGIDDWSVTNPYRVEGDKSIALEIIHQLGKNSGNTFNVPDYVIIPTANGSCVSGIWKGFKELFSAGLITKTPRIVSIGVENASPLFKLCNQSASGPFCKCDLEDVDSENMIVGSTILSEESFDVFSAYKAIKESNGLAFVGNAEDIRKGYNQLFVHELETLTVRDAMPEPCSVLCVTALERLKSAGLLSSTAKSVVMIFTGHARKSQSLFEEFSKDFSQTEHEISLKKEISSVNFPESNRLGNILSVSERPGDLERLLLRLI